jgi:hypothetical protein
MLSMDIQEYKMMQKKNNGCQQGQEFPDVGPFDWSPPQRCRCSSYRPACLPCHAYRPSSTLQLLLFFSFLSRVKAQKTQYHTGARSTLLGG